LTCIENVCTGRVPVGDYCDNKVYFCQDGVNCRNGVCTGLPLGAECEAWYQCNLPNYCINKTCTAPLLEGTPCGSTGGCGVGLDCLPEKVGGPVVCRKTGSSTKGSPCGGPFTCPDGLACLVNYTTNSNEFTYGACGVVPVTKQ